MTMTEGGDFGLLAVALGFLTRKDIEKVLCLQADLQKNGVKRRLGELLLERKTITREQALRVLHAQGKSILTCRACKKSYNIRPYKAGVTYTCKHCSAELSLPAKPVALSVNDSIAIPVIRKARLRTTVSAELVHLLPGYEMVERIGQGGMGTVYKAHDLIGDRWVAVKLLAPFLAWDKEYVKRFFREARNLQKLHHPNIVGAYDAGVAGEHQFFMMEFVDGQSLDKVLHKEGILSQSAALEITRQVAQALDYAWTHKIIHRDIKPQNIMLTQERHVKVCDLGLSKDITSDISVTLTGLVNCSPPYASPEQAQGSRNVDIRGDVYSLGVTLFQMVCGELPFKGRSPGQLLLQHATQKPPNPLSRNPKISTPVSKMILCMLEKDPADRPLPEEVARVTIKLLGERPQ